jgi:hypothetical protein
MWVDANGDVVRQVTPPDPINSFFIHGLQEATDEFTRAQNKARMQMYFDLVKTWGDKGIGGRVSEVYLDSLDDVRVHLAGNEAGIEVVLGNKDFGLRLERALRVIDEKRASLNFSYVYAMSDKYVIIGGITKPASGNSNARNGAAANSR